MTGWIQRKCDQVPTSPCPQLLSKFTNPLLHPKLPLTLASALSLPHSYPNSSHSQSHISKMQIWSCHFSAQKLLLPTAYRLESKFIKMEVSALEKLALTCLLASFLNAIFPDPSCSLLSLCKPLHRQPSCLEFPAVSRNQKSQLRQISTVTHQYWLTEWRI